MKHLTARTTKVTVIAGTGSDAKTEEITVTQSAANAYLTVEGLEADVPVRLDAAGTVNEFTITQMLRHGVLLVLKQIYGVL